MKTLPVAVQLYTVRDDLEKDFFGTLERVKALGYAGVEFAGFGGHSAAEVKAFLDKIGLQVVSSHVPLDALVADPQGQIAYHRALGCSLIAVPWLDEPRRPGAPGWNLVVTQVKALTAQCRQAGIQLLYHNHDFEFAKIDGRYALDILFDTIPDLHTELDLCWVRVAGEEPAAYLKKYTGRSPVVHVKDYVGGPGGQLYALIDAQGKDDTKAVADASAFDFRPLGRGVQDVPALLQAAVDAGCRWIIVEQDRSTERPPLEAIGLSREYLRTLGW